jgi:hypothetical protein
MFGISNLVGRKREKLGKKVNRKKMWTQFDCRFHATEARLIHLWAERETKNGRSQSEREGETCLDNSGQKTLKECQSAVYRHTVAT